MVDNKRILINEIFAEAGDGSPGDLLNCMEAFEQMLDDGYIEEFINDKGETDYRMTTKYDAGQINKELTG